MDATLAARALKIAAENGDAAFFAQLQRISESSSDPQLRTSALLALARFREPALATRALDYAVSPQVKNQDALRLVQIEMSDRHTRELAWKYVQQNWPQVQTQVTTWTGGSLVSSTGHFCSEERSHEVTQFFAQHAVTASEQALDRARDRVTDCVDLRAAQSANLQSWLRSGL